MDYIYLTPRTRAYLTPYPDLYYVECWKWLRGWVKECDSYGDPYRMTMKQARDCYPWT